ncbi:MAG: PLP-dependent aminotransferase family protein [Eubacterium sp.]|nr:PLP-dependent aminotransferase family protein [Eubacterium sp.]
MRPFIASSENKKSIPLYIQLYRHIKAEILSGEMSPGEKLPSLRKMASDSGVSLITSGRAYDQLLTEGYITSRPQSGYYVASLPESATSETARRSGEMDLSVRSADASPYICDEAAFDFGKWKKCTSRVLNDYSHLLLFESDVQGEEALRYEISKYVYSSRGVTASPDRIVIGAGTQQLTAHLCRILSRMGIGYICTEDPGYLPLQQVFRDNGFTIGKIPVSREGIRLDKLPVNIPAAVYVSPANQFPTGSVMPIGNRYRLLAWARDNDSYILEDDYDSELRYFGRPIPALQGLDENDRVVYLGSFSSTLFPAIKISYMILPERMAEIFRSIKSDYTQTCSKSEQLALALFMEDGYYTANIRRLRSLYSQKLQAALAAFDKYGRGAITPMNTRSGISMILELDSRLTPEELCGLARSTGLRAEPLAGAVTEAASPAEASPAAGAAPGTEKKRRLIFYYNQIPLERIDELVKELCLMWLKLSAL